MTRYIRLIAKATAAAFLLVLTGASAALAGPAPIEPEFPPPAATTTEVATADGFPWMLTSAIALLVIARGRPVGRTLAAAPHPHRAPPTRDPLRTHA